MKFIVDAQLPRRLCWLLAEYGHDALHTLDLPDGNRTSDEEIMRLADAQARVVVTKDDDFVRSFLIVRRPTRLLLIATGNIDNTKLIALLRDNLTTLVQAYEQHRFVELARYALVIHE